MQRDALSDTFRALEQGKPRALERLLPFVYAEMRELATHDLRAEAYPARLPRQPARTSAPRLPIVRHAH